MCRGHFAGLMVVAGLGLLSPRAAAQAQVIVVDDQAGPGVDFTTLDAAITAAAENDTILVRAGTYDGAMVGSKSLAIVAASGATVTVKSTLSVRNLGPTQFVSVSGITFQTTHGTDLAAISLVDNAGSVWLEHCKMTGNAVEGSGDGGFGVNARNCANVSLVGCDVHGGSFFPFFFSWGNGDAGLNALDSQVFLFDTTCTGGSNGCSAAASHCPSSSAPGIWFAGGKLMVEGSSLKAGYGGQLVIDDCPFPGSQCVFPGGQGPALYLETGNPSAWMFDTTTTTTATPPILVSSGTFNALAGTSRDFTVNSPVHESETVTLSLKGQSGDTAWLFVALKPGGAIVPKFKGGLMVSGQNLLMSLGPLPANGTLDIPVNLPAFQPGIETLAVALQAAFTTSGGAILSDPARLVMLSAAF